MAYTSWSKTLERRKTSELEGNIPAHCTCPAYEYHEGAYKRMISVALGEPVRERAGETRQLRADGDVLIEAKADDSDERPDNRDYRQWNDGLALRDD